MRRILTAATTLSSESNVSNTAGESDTNQASPPEPRVGGPRGGLLARLQAGARLSPRSAEAPPRQGPVLLSGNLVTSPDMPVESGWTPARPAPRLKQPAGAAAADRPVGIDSAPHGPVAKLTGVLAPVFRQNLNPLVREMLKAIEGGELALGTFGAQGRSREKDRVELSSILSDHGIDVQQQNEVPRHVTDLAEQLNVDPVLLCRHLVEARHQAEDLLATVNPRNPLLIDGSQPQTLTAAVTYVSTLLAQGIPVPAPRAAAEGGRTADAAGSRLTLQTTAMNSDIDGPFAASYGQQGLDIAFSDNAGTTDRLHVQLPRPLSGVPIHIDLALSPRESMLSGIVSYQSAGDEGAETQVATVPISVQQAQMIQRNQAAAVKSIDYVEGLSARHFSPESVNFWQRVSESANAGGKVSDGVMSNSIVFNTFGSHGTTAFNNAAELVTSFARSLPPRTLSTELNPGIFDAPNVRVYSGGTTLNARGVSTPVGLSETQQRSMREVADALPGLVRGYAEAFGLSHEAQDAWQKSIFANPDIPSVIIPRKTLAELTSRTDDSHPGRTFPDLQRNIEADVSRMITEKDMGSFITLHHTPSAPGDTLAVMGRDGGEFTTEWQFAVNGQKAMPVLDAVANDLQRAFGVDLRRVLEDKGHSYGALREKSLDETVEFFATFVRSRLDEVASQHGIDTATPHVIVPVDTYYEKNGKVDGSDASLIRSAAALYTPERVCVIQVDTGGGKETPGRSALFKIGKDAAGSPVLSKLTDKSGKGPVDPHGPNASLAPTIYARSAADMGKVFDQSYRNQLPPSADEVARVRGRHVPEVGGPQV
jgi:hypothetical protein